MAGNELVAIGDSGGPRGRGKVRRRGDAATEAAGTMAILEFQSPTAAFLAQPAPFSARMTIWLIAGLFISLCVVMTVMPIDQVATATGIVVSRDPNLTVQPLEAAIIRSINVRDGQRVQAGDIVAELDPTFATSDAQSTRDQAASLQAEVDRLTAELEGRPYVSNGSSFSDIQARLFAQRHGDFTAHVDQFDQQIESLRAKVAQAQGDIVSFSARLPGARKVEEMRRQLEQQQVGSKLNTLSAVDARMQLEGQLADAQAALAGALRDMAGMQAQREQYIQSWRSDTSQQLTQQGRTLADMSDQAEKNKLRTRLVDLRAAKSGVVLNIAKLSLGSVVQPGQQIMTIVPSDAQLEVEAYVSGNDAGFVRVGDQSTVKFNSFPYIRHGFATGVVRTLSSDSFANPSYSNAAALAQSPTDAQNNPNGDPGSTGLVFYRARVTLDEMKLRNLPPDTKIMPGMPVSAEIHVGERTAMDYILNRIIPAFTTGMREPG